MKAARAAGLRRGLRKRAATWPLRLEQFAYDSVPGLGSGEVAFYSPVTFISGANGAGKSTLLQALWAVLSPEGVAGSQFMQRRLTAGSASALMKVENVEHTCAARFSSAVEGDASHGLDVVHLDTSQEVEVVLSMLAELQADEGITSGIGEYKLNDDELGEIGFITRRTYRSVALFEIEEFDRVIPFFEVSYGEDRYDSRSMGAGELAAFLLWWTLFRIKDNSFILLEEPETFLSQASQEAIGSHILSVVTQKKLCAVVVTHSGPMIAPMPDEALLFLIRTREGVSFDNSAPPSLLTQLGIDPPVSAIVLVEDLAGAEFCRWILEKYDPRLARRIDVCVRNGDGNIVASLAQMADTRRIKLVGLFDGDVRTTTAEAARVRSTFLPGDMPIEQTFRALVTENAEAFGAIVGRDDIPRLLATLEGKEAHDWYHDLSAELGLSRTQLFPPMFRLWHNQDGSDAAARTVATALSELIDGADE